MLLKQINYIAYKKIKDIIIFCDTYYVLVKDYEIHSWVFLFLNTWLGLNIFKWQSHADLDLDYTH